MSGGCYVCGSTDISPQSRMGSPICEACLPAQAHVVSMQTASDGASLAICPCGWRSTVHGRQRYMVQQVKVRQHWRQAIAQGAASAMGAVS